MKVGRLTAIAGILATVAVLAGWLSFEWYRSQPSGEPYGVEFSLVDQRGNVITEAAFREQPTALFFGFTHCPEVCPTTLYEMDGWLESLGDDGKTIRAFFITVDPERDTPEVMNDYVTSVSNRITGITGDPEKIATMVKGYNVFAKRVEQDDGEYTMDHTASVILLSSSGRFFGTIAYGENTETAVKKLRRLARKG